MLLKASGSVPHTGGVLSRPGEPYYELLRSVDRRRREARHGRPACDAPWRSSPRTSTIPLPGMKQQLAVTAAYSDGSVRDVTARRSSKPATSRCSTVDKHGLADGRAPRRGGAAGPLRGHLCRGHGDRDGRPQRLRLEGRARPTTTSTSWSTPS